MWGIQEHRDAAKAIDKLQPEIADKYALWKKETETMATGKARKETAKRVAKEKVRMYAKERATVYAPARVRVVLTPGD